MVTTFKMQYKTICIGVLQDASFHKRLSLNTRETHRYFKDK